MAKIFNLPAVGDTMVEGSIVEWFVAVGDVVDLDQTICSIETDKSVVEMSTPHRGTVLGLGADVGGVVEVGSPLLIVGEPGEPLPELTKPEPAPAAVAPASVARPAASSTATAPPTRASFAVSPILRRFAHEEGVDLGTVHGTGPGGRITRADVAAAVGGSPTPVAVQAAGPVLALPKVRRMARESGIDLDAIAGTGPHGSITVADLPAVAPVRGRREPMTPMRRTIARNLTASAQQIPQFTSMVDFDASSLLLQRAALRDQVDGPMPLDAVLMQVLVETLQDHPLMNAQLLGDEIEYFDAFDIGVAVDTADGLMVPVVSGADALDAEQLGAEIARLAIAARERTIRPEELTGGTCTLNNVGALGILYGTPILPLNTSTIVAIGAARKTVQLRDGQPVELPIVTISGTFDHRLIDGGGSARFLKDLKDRFEALSA